jgi:hypothetical protein
MVFLNHIVAAPGAQRKQVPAGLPILGHGKRVSLRPTATIHRAVFPRWVMVAGQPLFFKKINVFQPVTPDFKVPFKGCRRDVEGNTFTRSISDFRGLAPDFQHTGSA